MSKKRRKSTLKFKQKHPREIGKFYRISDSSGGHPAMVYVIKLDEDTYFVQRFSQNNRKDRIELKHSIDPNSDEKEWLIKRPEAVEYDDLEYCDKYYRFRIHPDDVATVIKYQKHNLKKRKKNRWAGESIACLLAMHHLSDII